MERQAVERNTSRNARILVFGDDNPEGALLERHLREMGYTVCATVPLTWEGTDVAELKPDLALVDLDSKGEVDGLLISERLEGWCDVPVVCLTEDVEGKIFAREPGVTISGHVLKPFDPRQLHLNIHTALSRHQPRGTQGNSGPLEREAERLSARLGLMETIFESMKEGVLVVDEQGKTLFANPPVRNLAAGRTGSVCFQDWHNQFEIYFADQKTVMPLEANPLMRALQGEKTDRVEVYVADLPVGGRFVSVSARPLKQDVHGIGGAVAVFQDITGIKEAEARLRNTMRELREQSETMEAIFNGIRDGILVVDREGKYLYANPAVRERLGDEYEAQRGGEWLEDLAHPYYYPDRQTRMEVEDFPLARAIWKGQTVEDAISFQRDSANPDGGCYLRENVRPFFDEGGRIRGAVATYHDVTAQVLAEEALTHAFTQGRLEIVDTILHNIGNAINSVTTGIDTVHQHMSDEGPLRGLRALADAVQKHRDDPVDYIRSDPQGQKVLPLLVALAKDFTRQQEALAKTVARVRDRANHIADIVRTQTAMGGAKMVRKDIDLGNALLTAVKVLDDSLDRRKIRVDIDCGRAPREIRIQESQFHQAMVNIIKNAAEGIDELASSSGLDQSPRIRVKAYTEGAFLNIDVSDNGIGVADGDTRAIFAAGYSTKKVGTGLGLHSAANFVIGSGGEIDLLSEGLGKGATARIRLKLSSVTPSPLGQSEAG
ncbi:MAG: PAS domain-containing protein [Deltaproteobacteria bacterium]|nr:PAS domain-containing protein [Deltaproteobacteria bacterium]